MENKFAIYEDFNKKIINKDGTVTVVGDSGTVSDILNDLVEENTTPAVFNEDGSVKTAAVVPDASTLAVAFISVSLVLQAVLTASLYDVIPTGIAVSFSDLRTTYQSCTASLLFAVRFVCATHTDFRPRVTS